MQLKRILIVSIRFFMMTMFASSFQTVHAQDGIDLNQAEQMMSFNTVDLKDQLYFGLRTFLPEQQEFLDLVIAKVDSGEIPRAMVNVVFVWAKKRNPKIPFPYFEIALRLLAERRGVTI